MPILSLLTTTRSRLLSSTAFIRYYAAGGFNPEFVADFVRGKYSAAGNSTFASTITHEATTNATMVDSDGKLKWRPHNLLTYSEDFSNAAWQNGFLSNATRSDGDITILSGDGFGYHFQIVGALPPRVTVEVDVVCDTTVSNIGIRANDSLGTGANTTVNFVEGVPQRVVLSFSPTGSNIYFGVDQRAFATSSDAFGFTVTFNKAHLYRSDLGGMVNNPDSGDSYVPTTSSARYLPRIGHHVYNGSQWVDEGIFHESEARTNLVTYSNDMTAAGWSPANTTRTATTIIEDTATANHGIVFTGAGSTGYMTFSCDASNISGSRYLVLRPVGVGSGKAFAAFDIINGAVYATGGTEFVNADIIKAPNDSWRCSMAANYASAPSGYQVVISSDGTEIPSYAGDGTSGFTVTNHQYETGSTPSSYIPTTSGATSTRAAETLTIPAANLPWPSPVVIGEELVTNGTFDGDVSGWTTQAGDSVFTVSSGQLTISRSAFDPGYVYQIISTTAGSVYSVSFDVVDDGPIDLRVGTSPAGLQIASSGIKSSAGTYTLLFVATGITTYVSFVNTSYSVDATIDNVSVREIKPLSVSIQMDGRMTYADENSGTQLEPLRWRLDDSNYINYRLRTDSGTGSMFFAQAQTVEDATSSSGSYYSPDILVPFNIASRHGSTFINGAVDGVALTENTTPVALPDLSETDLQLGNNFMGTIGTFRMWADDIGDTGIEEASA